MKKIVSIFLCFVMLCTPLCVMSSAADISQTKTGKFLNEIEKSGGFTIYKDGELSFPALEEINLPISDAAFCYNDGTFCGQAKLFGFITIKLFVNADGSFAVYVPWFLLSWEFQASEEMADIFTNAVEAMNLLYGMVDCFEFVTSGTNDEGNYYETFRTDAKPYIIEFYSDRFPANSDLNAMSEEDLLGELQTADPEAYADVMSVTSTDNTFVFNADGDIIDEITEDEGKVSDVVGEFRLSPEPSVNILKVPFSLFDISWIINLILA